MEHRRTLQGDCKKRFVRRSVSFRRYVSIVILTEGAGSKKVNSGGASSEEFHDGQVMFARGLTLAADFFGAFGSR